MSPWKTLYPLTLGLALLISGFCLVTPRKSTAEAVPAPVTTAPPKLAVVIIIDQWRGDYFDKFGPYFEEGGFKRLLAGGMNFTNCHYEYAMTKTAPGHATIMSGVNPDVHGIIGNDWPDAESFKKLVAVQDLNTTLLGMPEGTPANELAIGRSPHFFLADTVGDQLKAKYGKEAKVVSISNKDRAAVLLAGRHPDAVLWDNDGRFITSSYYGTLPPWAAEYNAQGNAARRAGGTWDRLLPKEIYDKVQGPDDVKWEADLQKTGRTLPKQLPTASAEGSLKEFYEFYDYTPFVQNELVTLALSAVDGEKLGADAVPDVLCVGFSQIDAAGHGFGPDSHELMDSVLRLDRQVARLLTELDTRVGRENYVVVVGADHGIPPIPEVLKERDPSSTAERPPAKEIELKVMMALSEKFGNPGEGLYWSRKYASSFYLPQDLLKERGVAPTAVEDAIKEALLSLPYVAEVYTRRDMENITTSPDSKFLDMHRRSYYAPRSPDVAYLLKPNMLEGPGGNRTNHGTPYDYDTHVPQLYYGPGVPHGSSAERVSVTHIAPTLSGILQIPVPQGAKQPSLLVR